MQILIGSSRKSGMPAKCNGFFFSSNSLGNRSSFFLRENNFSFLIRMFCQRIIHQMHTNIYRKLVRRVHIFRTLTVSPHLNQCFGSERRMERAYDLRSLHVSLEISCFFFNIFTFIVYPNEFLHFFHTLEMKEKIKK